MYNTIRQQKNSWGEGHWVRDTRYDHGSVITSLSERSNTAILKKTMLSNKKWTTWFTLFAQLPRPFSLYDCWATYTVRESNRNEFKNQFFADPESKLYWIIILSKHGIETTKHVAGRISRHIMDNSKFGGMKHHVYASSASKFQDTSTLRWLWYKNCIHRDLLGLRSALIKKTSQSPPPLA